MILMQLGLRAQGRNRSTRCGDSCIEKINFICLFLPLFWREEGEKEMLGSGIKSDNVLHVWFFFPGAGGECRVPFEFYKYGSLLRQVSVFHYIFRLLFTCIRGALTYRSTDKKICKDVQGRCSAWETVLLVVHTKRILPCSAPNLWRWICCRYGTVTAIRGFEFLLHFIRIRWRAVSSSNWMSPPICVVGIIIVYVSNERVWL